MGYREGGLSKLGMRMHADAEAAQRYAEMKKFVRAIALFQLAYITGRTLWHVGLPLLCGGESGSRLKLHNQ